jgi:hypothetical protein
VRTAEFQRNFRIWSFNMKKIIGATAMLLFAGSAAYAAAPDAMARAAMSCCAAVAACCGVGLPCCP